MSVRGLDTLVNNEGQRPKRSPSRERIVQLGQVGGGGGGNAKLKQAKITGHSGTESPYTYSATTCVYDGSGELGDSHYTTSGGVNLGDKLLNDDEQGPNGVGLAPLPDGTIVTYWPIGGGYFGFSQSSGHGTFY